MELTREWALRSRADEGSRERAERVNAAYRRWAFQRKLTRFVDAWNQFARRYTQGQTFDLKLASEVDKAFAELKKDEGWLRRANPEAHLTRSQR